MPIHPRKDLRPLFDSVFHVTNRGYFCSLRRCRCPAGVSDCEDIELDVVALEKIELDDVLDIADGVVDTLESDAAWLWRRSILGSFIV